MTSHHFLDPDGIPAGGHTFGRGYAIAWQRGPLGRDADRVEPNGAFVEDVIGAARDRLQHYQTTKFANRWNDAAITALDLAMTSLQSRTADRESRGVEGTTTE